jgi:hypothetical protein
LNWRIQLLQTNLVRRKSLITRIKKKSPGGRLEVFLQLPHLYSFTAASLENYFREFGFETRFLSEKPGTLTLTGILSGIAVPPKDASLVIAMSQL